jgi:hypothetical protein
LLACRNGGKISGALRCSGTIARAGRSFLVAFRNNFSRGGVRMQRYLRGLLGALASVFVLWVGPAIAEEPSSAKAAEALIRKALDEMTALELVETPLVDVLEHLSNKHKINIQLDKKALDDAGLGSDTPITRSLKDVSLRSALKLMFRELDLTWVIEDEVLLITTVDEGSQRLETQIYDVDDLVTTEAGVDYDSLIGTITEIVAPNTWSEVGGPAAISSLHQMLVVSQTWEVHDEIATLLAELRRVRKARGDKPVGRLPGDAADAAPLDPHAVSVKVYKVAVPLLPVPGREEKSANVSPSVVGAGGGNVGHVPNDRYLEELGRAIPALVRPETWERGGGAGVLHVLPADSSGTGQLLVRQTAEVHAQLQRFLNELPKEGGGFGGGGFF